MLNDWPSIITLLVSIVPVSRYAAILKSGIKNVQIERKPKETCREGDDQNVTHVLKKFH
jgi:hypothetical protein